MAEQEGTGGGADLSAEEWAEFEKQFTLEATKTAAYKEPSARQRELTAKWKKEAPKDTGWRTGGPPVDLTSKSRRGQSPDTGVGVAGGTGSRPWGTKKRTWLRNLAWSVVASLVVIGIIAAPKLLS